jgi:hypothetical protein
MRRMTLTSALLATLAVGCVDDDLSLVILQNQVPGANCTIEANPTTEFRARGIIDARADFGYLFTPVVRNYAVTGGSVTEAQRLIQVQGADVELQIQPGVFTEEELAALVADQPLLTRFSARFSGVVEPDGGTTAFQFTLLSKALLDALATKLADDGSNLAAVQATVTIFGTMAGSDIKSDPFTYWVDVCDGCMQVDVGSCVDLPANFEASSGGECNELQDVPLECCTSSTSALVCPAEPETVAAAQ